MKNDEVLQFLDNAWDRDGFLGEVRTGHFSKEKGDAFLKALGKINIAEELDVPKRLLVLIWYLPSFLEWQKERISEKQGDTRAYEMFVTEVHNVLERVIGVP